MSRRTRSKSELYAIQAEAMLQFATTTGFAGEIVSDKKRQKKVAGYCGSFFKQMNSDKPFETPEEAVAALAPIAVWFIGWAARQFAIMVIKWLWNRWHSDT